VGRGAREREEREEGFLVTAAVMEIERRQNDKTKEERRAVF
jgi:hypothetical protein